MARGEGPEPQDLPEVLQWRVGFLLAGTRDCHNGGLRGQVPSHIRRQAPDHRVDARWVLLFRSLRRLPDDTSARGPVDGPQPRGDRLLGPQHAHALHCGCVVLGGCAGALRRGPQRQDPHVRHPEGVPRRAGERRRQCGHRGRLAGRVHQAGSVLQGAADRVGQPLLGHGLVHRRLPPGRQGAPRARRARHGAADAHEGAGEAVF
mmetsp:Transcript_25805/g.59861  ORF Transcript_25805/g.59861 Transcript_25805/m.59861 type:complete len:205 (-) Transcript_25805:1596-2210(-)